MIPVDPLSALERALVVEEVASFARHDLRNRFATIKNASFYLKRRVSKTEVWESDPRVNQFFRLIEDQLAEAGSLLDERLSFPHLVASAIEHVAAERVARMGVEHARAPGQDVVVLRCEPRALAVAPLEVALAIRCLVENALEASGGPSAAAVEVVAETRGEAFVFEVRDPGPGVAEAERDAAQKPFYSTKPGHAGLGLSLAQRIARRYGGAVTIAGPPSAVSLVLPLHAVTPADGQDVEEQGGGECP